MKAFTVSGDTPERFLRKLQRALGKGELGKYARMTLALPEATIAFEKMGTTEFVYSITQQGEAFTATKVSETVALTHALFRGEVERELERMVHRFGGTVIR